MTLLLLGVTLYKTKGKQKQQQKTFSWNTSLQSLCQSENVQIHRIDVLNLESQRYRTYFLFLRENVNVCL